MKDIVVIGAGPAGLSAAINIARKNKKVTVIERNSKCGKKLLMTGNGKCNYFNEDQDISHYHTSSKVNLNEIINKQNLKKVDNFFDSLGIIPTINNGYYSPCTKSAITIWNALIYEAKRLNVEIITDLEINEIKKEKTFIINPNKENIKANKIIIASGGKSMPKTGSDGLGYELAQKLGHKIIKPKPSLTGLKGKENYFKKWSGIRTDATLSLYQNDNLIKKETGTVQLTDYGISGIVSFNLSTYIDKNKTNIVKINFIPFIEESPYTWLKKEAKKTNYPIREVLERFLHYRLVDIILKKSNIKAQTFKNINEKDYKKLVYNLTNFEIEIVDTNSFEKAEVTKGGVSLDEINIKTLESKIVKNLYFAGEILDIDGDCGGYNLTNCWIDGIIIGENI